MPAKPRCTNDPQRFGTRVLPLSLAQGFRLIQVNRPRTVAYLVFDIDRPGGADAWRDANLPAPNATMTNRANGHAHIVYALRDWVWTGSDSHQGPAAFVEAIRTAYTRALRADEGYTGDLVKNPLHEAWRTELLHLKLYSLTELAEYVDLKGVSRRAQRPAGLGRNCTLFDTIRRWAYRQKARFVEAGLGLEAFLAAVEAEAHSRNRWADGVEPLPFREVQHTAKSIAVWTWRWYRGAGVSDSPAQRALQAVYGALKGRKKRELGLERLAAGDRPEAIAEALQVARSTVFAWARRLRGVANHVSMAAMPSTDDCSALQSGCHQVTADQDADAAAPRAAQGLLAQDLRRLAALWKARIAAVTASKVPSGGLSGSCSSP